MIAIAVFLLTNDLVHYRQWTLDLDLNTSAVEGWSWMNGRLDMLYLERDTLRGRFAKRKNARKFLSFLRWVRSQYSPGLTLHVILDNASYHETAEVLEYPRTHRILFYWTPTGASWLNRIECHFTAMRKFTLDNTDYRSHPEMQSAIRSYLRWRNRRRGIALTQKHSKPMRLQHAA